MPVRELSWRGACGRVSVRCTVSGMAHLDGGGGRGVSPGDELAGDGGHGFGRGMVPWMYPEMLRYTSVPSLQLPAAPYPRGVIPVARN